MAKQKHLLWLASKDTPLLHDKREQLKKHHFSCTLVLSIAQLAQELQVQRVPVIIVSEGEDYSQTLDFVMALGTIPDARGSRWVFVLTAHNPDLISLAACANFRDVIPLDLPEQQWLHRVLFSSASRSLPYPLPMTHITLDHPARLFFPGRIIWINRNALRLECPLTPAVGSVFTLEGKLFSALEPGELKVKVSKKEHTSLTFRFSTAIEGLWSHNEESQESLLNMIQNRSTLSGQPKFRIYLAIRSQENRKFLLDFFNRKSFDLNTALQLKNLVSEPSYYTPDMVILDEFLCRPPHQERFEKMLELLSEQTPVLIVGGQPDLQALKDAHPGKILVALEDLSTGELRSLVSRYLGSGRHLHSENEEQTLYFEKDDPFSCVFGVVQGRLSSVHPFVARIGSPWSFKNFSLCKVDSPFLTRWLGKQVWLKLTETGSTAPSLDHKMKAGGAGILADCSQQDKNQLARGLSLFIAKVLRTGSPAAGTGGPSFPEPQSQGPEGGGQQALHPPGMDDGIIGTTRYYDEQDDTPQSMPPDIKIENSAHDADLPDPVAPLSSERKMGKSADAWSETSLLDSLTGALTSKGFRYFLTLLMVGYLSFQLIRWIIPTLAKSYKKSGSVYTDQIEKFQRGEGR